MIFVRRIGAWMLARRGRAAISNCSSIGHRARIVTAAENVSHWCDGVTMVIAVALCPPTIGTRFSPHSPAWKGGDAHRAMLGASSSIAHCLGLLMRGGPFRCARRARCEWFATGSRIALCARGETPGGGVRVPSGARAGVVERSTHDALLEAQCAMRVGAMKPAHRTKRQ